MILYFSIEKKGGIDLLKAEGYEVCTIRRFCYKYLGYTKNSLEAHIVYWSQGRLLPQRIAWKGPKDLELLKVSIKEVVIDNFTHNEYKLWPYYINGVFKRSLEIKEKFLKIIYNG